MCIENWRTEIPSDTMMYIVSGVVADPDAGNLGVHSKKEFNVKIRKTQTRYVD